MTILIKQVGRSCEVWRDDEKVFTGGRVAAKQLANELHQTRGATVYNVKKGGSAVLVANKKTN